MDGWLDEYIFISYVNNDEVCFIVNVIIMIEYVRSNGLVDMVVAGVR